MEWSRIHRFIFFFFFNDTAPPEISPLPQHDALPISFRTSSTQNGGIGSPLAHCFKPTKTPVGARRWTFFWRVSAEVLRLETWVASESAFIFLGKQRRNPRMQLCQRLEPGDRVFLPRVILESSHSQRLATAPRVHRFRRRFQDNATVLGEREDLFADSKVQGIELLSNDNAGDFPKH